METSQFLKKLLREFKVHKKHGKGHLSVLRLTCPNYLEPHQGFQDPHQRPQEAPQGWQESLGVLIDPPCGPLKPVQGSLND